MKLSIITINRNNAEGLRKTIESVVNQTYTDFEYIVIDGASTDNSVEVIQEYSDRITYWISEPDKGIYNAMNKGILKATGEYLLFLNSGDWLVDDGVIYDFFNNNFTQEIISGNLILVENGIEKEIRYAIKDNELGYEHLYNNRIPHPSSFIKKNLFVKYGNYNENNKIVSDWEFFFKVLIFENCSYTNFNRIISCFDLSGISSKPENIEIMRSERNVVFRNFSPRIHRSFEKSYLEIEKLKNQETLYNEYMNLKRGKFGFFIKIILKLKKIFK